MSSKSTSLVFVFFMRDALSPRYLLQTLPSTYNPSDYRTFSQIQFMSLRCVAKMLEMAMVTGATGVAMLPREHQRIVSFLAAKSAYLH